jgi:hypothetical protein
MKSTYGDFEIRKTMVDDKAASIHSRGDLPVVGIQTTPLKVLVYPENSLDTGIEGRNYTREPSGSCSNHDSFIRLFIGRLKISWHYLMSVFPGTKML